MATPASIARHPIHPALVPLPIGLWIFSLVCDAVYASVSSDLVWDRMAFYTMLGGVAGALLAAVPGFIDFLSLTDAKVKRVALIHLSLNLTIVALYAVNLWLRTTSPPGAGTPVMLSIVGVLLLAVAGWLGGELVYRHGVAVDRPSPMRGTLSLLAFLLVGLAVACEDDEAARATSPTPSSRDPVPAGDPVTGREIFRFDTFGDERFWTDTLRMHEVIESAVDPLTALAVGLKVDADVLPPGILGQVDLSDPATTVALLELDAVVGLQAEVVDGRIERIGVTCALCHSDVDDSVQEGIGRRLDGYPNRDLDPGRILSLSPALQDPDVQAVLTSWGPGMYDAYWNHDDLNDPTVIPPAYGLNGVPVETFTGEGPVSYWNAYVAVTQMHGQGSFRDPDLGIEIVASPDLVTPKLPDLQAYQLTLTAPAPPPGSFDPEAAGRGEEVFTGQGNCASCHVPPSFTDAGDLVHEPSETGMDPGLAERGTTDGYRTTPLRGAWQHPPYFHDGSAATLDEVVDHYDAFLGLGLSPQQKADLVEYLKSL